MPALSRRPEPFAVMRAAIRGIDARLRRKMGIFEYNTSPGCMFRASFGRIADAGYLPETIASNGSKMIVLHLRSERVPPLPPGGPNLAYARKLTRMATDSFRMLAEYLRQDPQGAGVAAVGGITNLFYAQNIAAGEQIFSHLGLELRRHRSTAGAVDRFFTDLYAWMLMWTYNPRILRTRKLLEVDWYAFWISREALMNRYSVFNTDRTGVI